jgi:hypothetical protein
LIVVDHLLTPDAVGRPGYGRQTLDSDFFFTALTDSVSTFSDAFQSKLDSGEKTGIPIKSAGTQLPIYGILGLL